MSQAERVEMSRGAASGPTVAAWDLPTRVFHWMLALSVVWAWASIHYAEALGDPLLKYHRWNGLFILVLLLWRLMWGGVGPGTARFAGFVRGPTAALDYLRSLVGGQRRVYLGHNPLGAWMVLALLGVLIAQATAGLFSVDQDNLTAGPLYRFIDEGWQKVITRWHRWAFDNLILPLVAIHILANMLYGVIKREPLIRAMITGTKPADKYEDADQSRQLRRPIVVAVVLLLIAASIVFGGIKIATGRIV